ncbi:MAG: polyprenyl diphosphate synthase, partial [Lapillicoccus sp.]
MGLNDLVYGAYERRLARRLPPGAAPRHVGVMLDGNRRWARANGFETKDGHQAGADKIKDLLQWCEDAGVEVVTLWLLSTDNLSRDQAEIVPLLKIIENAVSDLAAERRWRLHPIGALDLLPAETALSLKASAEATRDVEGLHVNVAVGYGGRREIADAVRSMLLEHSALGTPLELVAEAVSVAEIEAHLYTKGQPDPELVIRT